MSYGLGDAQGYYRRRPVDRSFRSFACGHVVETRGSDSRYPSHADLSAHETAHGANCCPICRGGLDAQRFVQRQLRITTPENAVSCRWVSDDRHAYNLAHKLFREGEATQAELLINDVPTGTIWRAAQ